jgi:hypothetical protein
MRNVLVIPEDFRKDQYILKPLIEAVFALHGKPRANIRICNPPLLRGVTEALKSERLREIVDRYPMVDLFILCVDRDGQVNRKDRLRQIEQEFSGGRAFLASDAWEEIETWALAGVSLPGGWQWQAVRSEVSVKEVCFEPLAQLLGVDDGPGGGRKAIGAIAARSLNVVIGKCPEDFGDLSTRISARLAT